MTTIGELDLPDRTALPAAPDARLDHMALLTSRLLKVPIATVTLVSRDEQVFPGSVGMAPDVQEQRRTPLSRSVCQYVVAGAAPLVVNDARSDPRLANSPVVAETGVVAYAGMPLRDSTDRVVGTLCAIDETPRSWTEEDLTTLRSLADACSADLQLREHEAREVVDRERRRIAHDLHNEVFAELLTVSMLLDEAASASASPAVASARSRVEFVLGNIGSTVYARASNGSPT